MFFFFIDPADIPVFTPGLGTLESSLDLLMAIDPGMPIGAAAALIRMGRRMPALATGQETLKSISSQMEVPYATFLRHTDLLSDGAKGTKALRLIEKGIHPDDRRARQIRLTPEGLSLLQQLDDLHSKPEGPVRADAEQP
jgi:DNA-binding MarR family transcriptional regulator